LEHLYLLNGNTEWTLNREVFRLAWGPRPKRVPSSDLFEGLKL
jgi:hypothetical protein